MNWALIIKLSLFGLAMGVATVFFIPAFWLGIFIVCAFVIAVRFDPGAVPDETHVCAERSR